MRVATIVIALAIAQPCTPDPGGLEYACECVMTWETPTGHESDMFPADTCGPDPVAQVENSPTCSVPGTSCSCECWAVGACL